MRTPKTVWAGRRTPCLALVLLTFVSGLAQAEVTTLELVSSYLEPIGKAVAASRLHVLAGKPDADGGKGAVNVYDAATGKLLRTLKYTGSLANDAFGTAVAVRGTEAVIGAPGAGTNQGAVYLFDLLTGKFIRKFDQIAGTGKLGACLACEGDMILAGAPASSSGGTARGKVVMLVLPVGTPATKPPTRTADLVPADPSDNAAFGSSVAIYGRTIAVGAPMFNGTGSARGKVYLFDALQTGTSFTEATSFADGATADYNEYGFAVALTAGHLLVGCPYVSGQGTVFVRNLRTGDLKTLTGEGSDRFGYAVAASENLFAVGAPDHIVNANSNGKTYVYSVPDDDPATPLLLLDAASPRAVGNPGKFGTSLALAGSLLVAGQPGLYQVQMRFPIASQEGQPGSKIADFCRKGSTLAPQLASGMAVQNITQALAFTDFFGATSMVAKLDFSPLGASNIAGSGVVGSIGDVYRGLIGVGVQSSLNLRKITAMSDAVSNYPAFFGIHVTGTNYFDSKSIVQDYFIIDTAYGTNPPPRFYAGMLINDVFLKSFLTPRHGTLALAPNQYFVAPATYAFFTTVPVSATSDSGFTFFKPDATVAKTIREGTDISPFSSLKYGQAAPRCGFEKRNLVFNAALQGATALNNQSLISYDTETDAFAGIARSNDIAAGTGGAAFSAFLGENANGAGANRDVLFRATLRAPAKPAVANPAVTAANNEGLWSNRGGVSPPALVVRKGDAVIGTGVKAARFLRYWINTDGDVFALLGLTGTGVTAANDVGLFRFNSGGGFALLLREGDPAPGLGAARVGVISLVDGREAGNWVALVTLVQKPGAVTAADDQALYVGGRDHAAVLDQPIFTLRKGMRVERAGSEIVKSMALNATLGEASGAGSTGLAHVIDSQRTVSAILTYADGLQTASLVRP